MRIYRGEFVDTNTDSDNQNNQKVIRIDIGDKRSNPYNVQYSFETVGPNILYTFTFDTLPAEAFQTQIVWSSNGGASWNTQTGGTSSPQTITLPPAVYLFQFIVYFPDNVTVTINFEDEIIDLELTDYPLRISVIDNDEDVFTPIRAKQAEINIYSGNGINIATFAYGEDFDYPVNIYYDGGLIFTGFLSVSELSQEFLPDPNVISLVATDGLGRLSEIPLTDFDGETPENEQEILLFVLWCLAKTGLGLNLAVGFNIREQNATSLNSDTNGGGHFFKFCYLNSKTFEDQIGTCINCFDVLTKIFGFEMQLHQREGEWRIMRIDEIEYDRNHTIYRWQWDGTFIDKQTEVHEKNIGVGEDYSWMNDDALQLLIAGKKELRLTYKYELPIELVCNIDFSRGDYVADIDADSKKYNLDCWEQRRENWPATGDIPADANIYLRRDFNGVGYESNRYVVIEDSVIQSNFIMSSNFPVNAQDKVSVQMSRRMSADVGGSGFYRDNGMQIRLYGNDGTRWTLSGETSGGDELGWVESDTDFTINNKYLWFEGDVSRDMTEAEGLYGNTESPPIPVAGYLRFCLHQTHQTSWGGVSTFIDSFSFDYYSYINGAYQKYTAQQHIVASGSGSTREDQVYMSDSPNQVNKGAILVADGSGFRTSNTFYNGATEPDGPIYIKPYGEIQLFDVWNQINRVMARFEGTIDKNSPLPDLLDKFFLTDANEMTNNRIFLLLHYEMDMHLCEWSAFFTEVQHALIAKKYTDNTFKYLTK